MKILITGSGGRIGTILKGRLPHEIAEYNRPKFDASNYAQLVEQLKGCAQVLHLAWNTKTDNYVSDFHDSNNTQLAFNVYRASVEAGVKRVIVASSVHAHMPLDPHNGISLDPSAPPFPDSPYGAGKVFVEALGRYYATRKKLEVICLRFGSVGWGKPNLADPEHHLWLSDRDCIQLVKLCVEVEEIPNSYAIINAVSNNKGLMHDLSNPVSWRPLDGIV